MEKEPYLSEYERQVLIIIALVVFFALISTL